MSTFLFTDLPEHLECEFKFSTCQNEVNLDFLRSVNTDEETHLDPNLIKAFRMAQLSLEWYRYSQELLVSNFNQLKDQHLAQVTHLQQELVRMQTEKEKLQNEILELQEMKVEVVKEQSERPTHNKTEENLESGLSESEDECDSLVDLLRTLSPMPMVIRRSRSKFVPTLETILEESEEEENTAELKDMTTEAKEQPQQSERPIQLKTSESPAPEENLESEADMTEEEYETLVHSLRTRPYVATHRTQFCRPMSGLTLEPIMEAAEPEPEEEAEPEKEKGKKEKASKEMSTCKRIKKFFTNIFKRKSSGKKNKQKHR